LRNQRTAALWKLPKSGDSIIDTSAAPPSQTLWNALSPAFGLFAYKQLFLEIPRQCEFSGIQSGRLAGQDFHHLDIFINLADQKRQIA